MSLNFKPFRNELEAHFQKLSTENEHLFVTAADKDKVWETYLETIPPKDNQIYKTRREFDCSCCRHFVKEIGRVVAIKDGRMISIWDFEPSDSTWGMVAKEISKYVKSFAIQDVYLSQFAKVGTDYNMMKTQDGQAKRWDHFFVKLPDHYVFNRRFDATIDGKLSLYRDIRNVFKRALDEFTIDAIDTVLELINQNSLYRGDEYKYMVESFRQHKIQYDKLDQDQQELYAWENSVSMNASTARIRNTAIGTLLINITDGMDLEESVSKYEAVTAPANYKRSKPIFTQKMLEDAKKTLTDLGYLDSLERRYANADDISVNNILFSNKDVAKRIQGTFSDIFDQMSKDVKSSPKRFDRVQEIGIEDFVHNVLPTATEVKVYVENKHTKNLVSLIAPVNRDSKTIFKWGNNFSWAYTGNLTDSTVKQNVKSAGGKVDGALRFSIQWNDGNEWDGNDLDAHAFEPGGREIFFNQYKKPAMTSLGGQLDIDIMHPKRDVPAVENITWADINRMKNGEYRFFVHCFANRGGRSGFRAEIEFEGQIYSFDYPHPLSQDQIVEVATVILKDGKFSIKEKLKFNVSSRECWNIYTNEFVPVSVICYSPNYWDKQNGIGNKHYFFMLKDCINPELPNAWYNEFLNGELYPKHRKVMEAMASRCHVKEEEDQLSGLGFSSTLRNELVVKVKGATERILKIKF